MNLPIDVVPGTNPPKFRWRQVVDTPSGKRTVECEGTLPASAEVAVASLIGIAKQHVLEIAALRKELKRQLDELEKLDPRDKTPQPVLHDKVVPIKKGKG